MFREFRAYSLLPFTEYRVPNTETLAARPARFNLPDGSLNLPKPKAHLGRILLQGEAGARSLVLPATAIPSTLRPEAAVVAFALQGARLEAAQLCRL